jgi:Cft2 family RNA processing exonuclease
MSKNMKEKQKLKIRFLGALSCVTGSSTLIEFTSQNTKKRYLVDLGLVQNDPTQTPDIEISKIAKTLDGIFITHAHADHIGRLPIALDAGFKGKIYLTKATFEISRIMLEDQLNIQKIDNNKKYELLKSFEDKAMIFDDKENFGFGKTYFPLYNDFQFMVLRSSHILGACSYAFRWNENIDETENINYNKDWNYLYFSGDLGPNMFGEKSNFLYKNNQTIYSDKMNKFIIEESTYGNRIRDKKYKDHNNRLKKLTDIINSCQNKGERLIIPSFSLDRSQQILIDLNLLQSENTIHKCFYSAHSKIENHTLHKYTLKFIDNLITKYDNINLFSNVTKILSQGSYSTEDSNIFSTADLEDFIKYKDKWNEFLLIWEDNFHSKFTIDDYMTKYTDLSKKLRKELIILDNKYYSLENEDALEQIPIEIYSNLIGNLNVAYINNLADSIFTKGEIKTKYISSDYISRKKLSMNERTIKNEFNEIFEPEKTLPIKKKGKTQKRSNRKIENLNNFPKNSIILTSSGMIDKGKILTILEEILLDENTTLLLTGYQSPNTNGYLLQHYKEFNEQELYNKKIIINENSFVRLSDIKCNIEDMSSYYSGHADQEQLVKYATWPIDETNRTVFLNHGDDVSREALKKEILKAQPNINDVIIPSDCKIWYTLKADGNVEKEAETEDINLQDIVNKSTITENDDNNIKLDLSININKKNLETIINAIKEILNN